MKPSHRRQLDLVIFVADFLSDWVESDESACIDFVESLNIIESYGVKLTQPCDALGINAVRHLKDIVNPWNENALPDILQTAGFTLAESEIYSRCEVPFDGLPTLH